MRDDELVLKRPFKKDVLSGNAPRFRHVLRGAPLALLRRFDKIHKEVLAGREEKKVYEVLVEGPGGSGKTRGISLGVIYRACVRYPGIRVLVLRDVKADLATSWQKTWEEDVVPPTHPMIARPLNRQSRKAYNFWNGLPGGHPTVGASVVELGGMDEIKRHRGSDYDIIYCNELVEFADEGDYSELLRALRNWGGARKAENRMPFQLLISDTNPDSPDHWVNLRFAEDNMPILRQKAIDTRNPYDIGRYYTSRKDNPKFFDVVTNDYTPEGRATEGSLDNLHGVRRARLKDGEWVAAEGVVFENFSRKKQLIARPAKPVFRWFAAAMDWGWTDPCCLLVGGIDENHHLHIVCEIYAPAKPLDWWCQRVTELKSEYGFGTMVVDPSRPEIIDTFNRHLRAEASPVAIKADNTRTTTGDGDFAGIDLVRWYLDGRLWIWKDRQRFGPDQSLVDAKQPTNMVSEFGSYTYRSVGRAKAEQTNRRKEMTDPSCPDHGMDALRYLCTFVRSRDLYVPPEKKLPVDAPERDIEIAKAMGIDLRI